MTEEKYKGIPRNKIPWYPIIDYGKCIGCGKCVEYCTLRAYEFIEDGAQRPVLKNPYNCVVVCTGCESQCPEGATHHPSKEVTRKIIKNLQNFKSV